MPPERQYVLGTDDVELARLGLQHQLWSAVAHDAWERARIRPGSRVLDVGCGPGYASANLGHLVGAEGLVYGVDESRPFIGAARQRADVLGLANCRFEQGDVHDLAGAGVPDETFDAAYARWVLCFVEKPERVLEGVARALKPGGRFVIQDYFNWRAMRIFPDTEAFQIAVNASGQAWRDSSGNPDLVAHILPMLEPAGLEEVDLKVHQRIARPGRSLWAWPDSYWRSFIPRLVDSGHLTRQQSDDFFKDWAALSSNPHAIVQTPPVYELIAQKR